MFRILVINPGSTSTKLAVFDDNSEVFKENISHPVNELSKFEKIIDQYEFRKDVIIKVLSNAQFDLKQFSAIVGRGGLLKPIPSGTYLVNELMIETLKKGEYGEHASNLGAILAKSIAEPLGIPAYIVDPVVVDEMEEIARLSGLPQLKRKSIFHALNQKAVGRRAAEELGKEYEDCNFIIAHLGGGISVGAHRKGKVVDVNNALNGDGPFTPERSGGLPAWDLVKLSISGQYTKDEIKKMITGKGGVVAYLGTNDMREVEKKVMEGDKRYKLVFEAMAYQVAKEIASLSAVLSGNVDAIILTGGLAYSEIFTNWIIERVKFIAKVLVYGGEDEMKALALGALRVLKGEEKVKLYK